MKMIKNYKANDIDINDLHTNKDWDIIELNWKLDPVKAEEYFNEVEKKFRKETYFNFTDFPDLLDIEISKQYMEGNYCGYYCGPIGGYTIGWPIDRDIPIPPPNQVNKEVFPEVLDPEFEDKATLLDRYNFGYMKDLVNFLGDIEMGQPVITMHGPGAEIKPHVDSQVKKIHIVLKTNDKNVFCFGPNHERKYHMEAGKAYIINTHIHHGTLNEGTTERAHILARIQSDKMFDCLNLQGTV